MALAYISGKSVPQPRSFRDATAGMPPMRGNLHFFSTKVYDYAFPLKPDSISFYLHPMPAEFFGRIVVAEDVPLYRSGMTLDYLARLYNALQKGGELLILRGDSPPPIQYSIDELQALIPGSTRQQKGLLAKRGGEAMANTGSVLDAFWRCSGDLVLMEALSPNVISAAPGYAAAFFQQMLLPEPASAPASETKADSPDQPKPSEASDAKARVDVPDLPRLIDGWLRYRVGGAFYKVPVLMHVLRQTFGSTTGLTVCEHGGSVGLVPMQLALEPDSPVGTIINRDVDKRALAPGKVLFEALQPRLAGRYSVSMGPSEAMAYQQEFDVISFIHVLLYLRRSSLVETLGRAFKALKPGGALVSFENTKPPVFPAGYDGECILSPDELDSALSTFGEIVRYDVKTGSPCSREHAEKGPVIRLVRKPGGIHQSRGKVSQQLLQAAKSVLPWG